VAAAQRAEAETRARLRNEFFAGMSHELRTPLSAALGFAASLRAGGQDEAAVVDVGARIETVCRDLLGIINNILDAAKLESGHVELLVEDVDVGEAIRRVMRKCEPLAAGKPLALDVDVSPDVPRVRADFVKLQQVLTNLVANAIKFTDRGAVRVAARRDGALVAIEVADTGSGIAPAALAGIWTPFRQADGSIARRYGGSGLGLSIVKGLVTLMRGSVDVRSTEGAGSVFTVRLPAADAPYTA
ncbi:MAG TPA: HAMP domain-containing sensor histidine kinase, partial [Minicystis sp.]|nr:HAMP domain-containing sensor histidine kinase [Minicystis sp.]